MLKTWTGITEIKEEASQEGLFIARIATLGVMDKDRDVTVKGAFAESPTVRVSKFNHSSAVRDDLPVGVANIFEKDDAVFAEGQLNLETAGGRELYDTLKFEQEKGVSSEWSYGFSVLEAEPGEQDDQQVRFLKRLHAFEVSPVMRGAGENTATIAVKEEKTATGYGNLPLYERDMRWNSGAAIKSIRKWASSDGSGSKDTIKWSKYRRAFMWVDTGDANSFGGYKLPFAQVTDDKLYAVPRGIFAVAAVLQGSRGGVAISASDQASVKSVVEKYYAKMRKKFSDDSIVAPWSKDANEGITLAHDAETVLATVDVYLERVRSLADLRLKEGRELSSTHRTRLKSLTESMSEVITDLETLITEIEPSKKSAPDALVDLAKFQRLMALYGTKEQASAER